MNVMLWPGLPSIAELAQAGARRISQGAASFLSVLGHLDRSARAYLDGEPADFGGDVVPAFHLIPQLAYRV